MAKRAFTFKDDKSDKFWWIECGGTDFVVNYGKTGTAGKYQIKEFDSEELCLKEAVKMIAQKQKKGYKEAPDFDFDKHLYFDDEEIGLHLLTSHPNFREYFTDELYYNCGDEEAPFGSDEGNDTLYELVEAVRKKSKVNFAGFPQYLIENIWGMTYIAPGKLDEETVKGLIETDEMNLTQSDMITYASAFGQIKITGYVDKSLKEAGIMALQRAQVWAKLQGYNFSEITEMLIKDLSAFEKYAD
ncbi:WGR domain-containing protein [Dysgonomonas sp. 25]|uniref:WGR domain-containing protein n=1 Tax=Dysgonomonas sp. 25 TaxID=2302933 RepID=UPI0013D8AAF3|nr:WGR domain-containing protein [Dysgonomonas sp. 25]NDV69189.1 WGR domain-containing protein [Dysgonomonas sp. 25]